MADLLVPVGIDVRTRKPITLKLNESNAFVGGATRSGKSVFMNCLIASVCLIPNIAILLVDPKRVEFSKFAPRASCYVKDQREAGVVFSALVAEMERRYAEMEKLGLSKITDYDRFPLIMLFADEMAYLMNGEDKKLAAAMTSDLITLQQVALACGISVIGATQKPSEAALGKNSTIWRDNFGQRICMMVSTRSARETVIQDPAAKAENIPKNAHGFGYISTETTDGARLFQSFFITDDEARAVAEKTANMRVSLPWLDEALKQAAEADEDG